MTGDAPTTPAAPATHAAIAAADAAWPDRGAAAGAVPVVDPELGADRYQAP